MADLETLHVSGLTLEEGSAPSTPASGFGRIYVKTTGLFFIGDDGVEVGPLAAAGAATFVGAKVYNGVGQARNNAYLTFASEEYDTNTFHDTGSNTSRLTVPSGQDGKYLVQGSSWLSVTTNVRLEIHKNGAVIRGRGSATGASAGNYTAALAVLDLVATDYVELFSSGSATWGDAGSIGDHSVFSITKL